jgi:hypothetical protein
MSCLCCHLRLRRILALPLLGALCSFHNTSNLDFSIIFLGYLKHSFLDHSYGYSLLATSTSAQRAATLLEHYSHSVCAAPAVIARGSILEYLQI